MRKIFITQKKKSIFILPLLLGLPVLLQIPSVSAAVPDYDVNSDGLCNIMDFILIVSHFRESGSPGWIREDVDKNGIINLFDIISVSHNYGKVMPINDTASSNINVGIPSGARIQKWVVVYSGRISDITISNWIANTAKFDLIDTDIQSGTSTIPNIIKPALPNCIILGYWESMSQGDTTSESQGWKDWADITIHEDWFIHTKSGSRIERSSYAGQWLMNPNPSVGWTNYFANKGNSILTKYSYCDGFLLDDHISSLEDQSYGPYGFYESFSSFGDGYSDANYRSWRKSQVTTWRSIIDSDKMLMSNCFTDTEIATKTGAMMYEHFIKPRSTESKGQYNTDGITTSDSLTAINLLHNVALKGVIIASNSGCSGGTDTDKQDWAKYVYACLAFALVDPAKSYFGWQFMGTSPTTNPTWYPWEDNLALASTTGSGSAYIGTPTDEYHMINGTSAVYTRTFSNYYVIANLGSLGTYQSFIFTPTGQQVTNLEGKHSLFIPQ